ncbi:MAG: hypothetical protein KY429_10605 [Actinobacteria bacterium]|nr:hypothetical protein [Actinomycetota bacterium]
MTNNRHVDKFGEYRYHPRSNSHSKALSLFVLEDLLESCTALREQAEQRRIVYGIDTRFRWDSLGKTKTLDLALGPPLIEPKTVGGEPIVKAPLADVLVACEAKSCMTEHGKSKPRLYDELSSSHEIVHQGRSDAIACGITVINIAKEFVSPTRQKSPDSVIVSVHKQPGSAGGMIEHLRGLRTRTRPGEVGFDAYSTVVIDCDNRGPATLWIESPAPQQGDSDHYDSFLDRIVSFYGDRFGRE